MKRRGRGNWQQLSVQWRIALPGRARQLSKQDQSRARLTAFLQALETGTTPSWARISYLAWQNPDADHEPQPILNDNDDALVNLSTLNKGGWLESRVRRELNQIGGELRLERQPTSKRKKKRRTTKKLANVARKRPRKNRRKTRKRPRKKI